MDFSRSALTRKPPARRPAPPRAAVAVSGKRPAWPRDAADTTWAPSFQNEKLSRNETRMDGDGSLRLARALRNATQHTDVLFGDDVRTAYQLLARVLQHESRQQGFELAATQDANFHEVGAAVSAGSCRGSGAALPPAELHRRREPGPGRRPVTLVARVRDGHVRVTVVVTTVLVAVSSCAFRVFCAAHGNWLARVTRARPWDTVRSSPRFAGRGAESQRAKGTQPSEPLPPHAPRGAAFRSPHPSCRPSCVTSG